MDNIYDELAAGMGSLKEAETEEEVSGMDSFLSGPQMVTGGEKVKVASLGDLSGFLRIADDLLVNKAQRDLWRISEDKGQVVIERLFDAGSNEPIRV